MAVIQRQMLPPNLVHQMRLRQKTGLTSLISFIETASHSLVPAITAQEWKLCVILRSLNIITLGKYPIMNIKDNYVWYIHRSGFNYSNSLSSANTDIRKKLYEYYLAQHTSSSNKKGWDWSDKSATHSFKSLENNTTQDVFGLF